MARETKTDGTPRHPANLGGDWQGEMPRDRRLAFYLRARMSCAACGASMEDGAALALDHLHPHSRGGDNSDRNIVVMCGPCNSSKGAKDLATWLARGGHPVNGLVDAPEAIIAALEAQAAESLDNYRADAQRLVRERERARYLARKAAKAQEAA